MSTTAVPKRSGVGRKSVAGGNMGFRASKAFSSVQGLAFGGAGGTAGGKPGAGGLPLEEETPTDLPGLKMQNERLTNALIVLNQKLKVHEDNEDLNEKWKA